MKVLIVNADDFGYSRGINRGIAEAHDRGIVTSASLMINAPYAREAIELAGNRPDLSLGIHVNFTNEGERLVEFIDPGECRAGLVRQLDLFCNLVGQPPTHLDSHQHVHRGRTPRPIFQELAREYGIPLRDEPPVIFKGGFYGQWEFGVSNPDKVSVAFLSRMLREEFTGGIYELCCHPGYFDAEASFVYHQDRELELHTLTDPRIRELLAEVGIRLMGFRDLPGVLQEMENVG
ncbi:MAG TPA: ChbG/HpnK family deacetylase [Vicinamibacteria bacterium]|nr:ChbG/HpnK family deacetylase [Vicinamibacteria bacterium]